MKDRKYHVGRVLVIAGSDSGGGAGIQADIKTITALGGYAATAITALTAQDTNHVQGIFEVPATFVTQQMKVVLGDIGCDIIKTGMLHNTKTIEAVADFCETFAAEIPIVVDPVMVAESGAALLEKLAKRALVERLVSRASVVTPNLDEAELIIGSPIRTGDEMVDASHKLLELGPKAVVLKGGHLPGKVVRDILITREGMEIMEFPRIDTHHTHGTGCTLASALATGLAQGMELREAVVRARAYVHEALKHAPGFGSGHGPIGHTHTVRAFMQGS